MTKIGNGGLVAVTRLYTDISRRFNRSVIRFTGHKHQPEKKKRRDRASLHSLFRDDIACSVRSATNQFLGSSTEVAHSGQTAHWQTPQGGQGDLAEICRLSD